MPASTLSTQRCIPCTQGAKALSKQEAEALLQEIRGWRLTEEGKALEQEFVMKDFLAALDFMSEIAQVAEAEDHHPDLHLTGYRKLRIVLSTHSIGGLSKNDFILAAKIDPLPKHLKT